MPLRTNGYLSLGLEHPLNLQIGYSLSGYKSFVVMETGEVSNIPSSFAIKAENVQLRNGTWILAFQLVHIAFEEEFLRLCWDMIEATAKSATPQRDLIARYLSWQKLLQYSSKEVMSFQRQKGLLGELLYLSDCLLRMPTDCAVDSWTGPDGSDQDFIFESAWAEVKTVALSADTVKISSMQQLEQEVPGSLIVYTLEKSTEGEGRITLPAIAEKIKSFLHDNPAVLDRFEMKLFKYGYRSQDVGEYNKNHFRFIEKREYLVDDSFPKLCRENVAREITACTYEISLSAIEAQFNERYFQSTAALLLMFQFLEQKIPKQIWYEGGYRANVIYYTTALFRRLIKQQFSSSDLDLMLIWNKQELPEIIQQVLLDISGICGMRFF